MYLQLSVACNGSVCFKWLWIWRSVYIFTEIYLSRFTEMNVGFFRSLIDFGFL